MYLFNRIVKKNVYSSHAILHTSLSISIHGLQSKCIHNTSNSRSEAGVLHRGSRSYRDGCILVSLLPKIPSIDMYCIQSCYWWYRYIKVNATFWATIAASSTASTPHPFGAFPIFNRSRVNVHCPRTVHFDVAYISARRYLQYCAATGLVHVCFLCFCTPVYQCSFLILVAFQ